jgi:5-(aminomethyl)-3-furanmethanol phosphate kinase
MVSEEASHIPRLGEQPVVVYKVGGSLFDWPELFPRLIEFFNSEPTRPLIVSGGGAAADVVRDWDQVHRLGDVRSHRLAIRSLSLAGEFLADGLGARIVSHRQDAKAAWAAGRIAVLDAATFIEREIAADAVPLPATWDVTSDSIAAWVAARWPARLTLVKSASPGVSLNHYVDSYFARAGATLKNVEWVNLRDGERGAFPAIARVATPFHPSSCVTTGT